MHVTFMNPQTMVGRGQMKNKLSHNMSFCGVLYSSDDDKGEFQHVLFLFTRYANITKKICIKISQVNFSDDISSNWLR